MVAQLRAGDACVAVAVMDRGALAAESVEALRKIGAVRFSPSTNSDHFPAMLVEGDAADLDVTA
jgi:hypothetical protein